MASSEEQQPPPPADELAAQFCSVTGLNDASQASLYLEMAGGSLETAVMLFFDSGGGGVGGGVAAPAPSGGGGGGGGGSPPPPPPGWFHAIWPRSVPDFGAVPESWSGQSLAFAAARYPGSAAALTVGLDQPKNGPCGVAAAVQAACVAEVCRRRSGSGSASAGSSLDVTDDVLASVLSAMLWQARPCPSADGPDPVRLVTGPDGSSGAGGVAVAEYAVRDDLDAAVVRNLGTLRGPGGPLLLVYSLVLTRTVDGVKADVSGSGGDLPLVTDSLYLCTSDLVSLCLRGRADGNVGAYLPVSDENGDNVRRDWPEALGVGLLSMDELQTKIPVADALKLPRYPVWVLHGGDHFTVLWVEGLKFPNLGGGGDGDNDDGDGDNDDSEGAEFSVLHWNGLPPSGPRLAKLRVRAEAESAPAPKKRKAPRHYEPVTGEIESIVQADPEMKKSDPHGWARWRYEVQLAGDATREEGTKYDARPDGARLPPTFDLREHPPAGKERGAWRCAACYSTRFQTMCFGMNDVAPPPGGKDDEEEDPKCQHCGRTRSVAGWTVWLTYDELPDSWKRSADRQFAPKIVTLLRTKWPGCDVEMVDDASFGEGVWPSV